MALPANCNLLKKNPGIGEFCCLDKSQTDYQCPQNSTCDQQTAQCEKGTNYCTQDVDCQGSDKKYMGLTCDTTNNVCKCTKTGYLCTDTTVCVASPGPAPAPTPTPWPQAFVPLLPTEQAAMWTNLCSDSSSTWFTKTCPTDQDYVGGMTTSASGPPTPECISATEWKGQGQNPWTAYSKLCYVPQPRA